MKTGVFLFLGCLLVGGSASAGPITITAWTDNMLSRFPFRDDRLALAEYRTYANSFVEEKKRFFDGVFGRLLEKAEGHGMDKKAQSLKLDHERTISKLSLDVNVATEKTFGMLDLDKDGVVRREEAWAAIRWTAHMADLNDDGKLDDGEQALAEWSLSTGNLIAAKDDTAAITAQFEAMERSAW